MNSIFKKIRQFLVSNTVWIFIVLLLFHSYLLLVSVVKNSWSNYLLIFFKLCICFSPILLFTYFRKDIKQRFPMAIGVGLWIYSFVIHPILLYIKRKKIILFIVDYEQFSHPDLDIFGEFATSFLLTVSGALLLTELVLSASRSLKRGHHFRNRLEKIDIDIVILGVFILMSALLAIKGLFKNDVVSFNLIYLVGLFLVYWFQYILISLTSYFYYIVNKKVLVPKILEAKGFIHFGFSVAGIILVTYPIFVFFIRLLPIVETLEISNYYSNTNLFASDGGAGPFVIIALSIPVIISNQWYRQNSRIANLEKEKSETELSLLKQQINPHFFFNTLNNLYALSITNDKQTPEVILQLSELMRYVIYKGKENLVPLHEEIKYIEDYIQLQQIRLHKQLDFTFEKQVETINLEIPPLLFITFVENAFKHGIEPAEGACYLHLSLHCNENSLTFTCTNSVDEANTAPKGIGLENLRRRLELRYPNQHQLDINTDKNSFFASLKVDLI